MDVVAARSAAPRLRDRALPRRAGRNRTREEAGRRPGSRHRRSAHLHALRRSGCGGRVALHATRDAVDLLRHWRVRRGAAGRGLSDLVAPAPGRRRAHHRGGCDRRVPAGRPHHFRPPGPRRRARYRDRRDARIQAAAARAGRAHRTRRPLRRPDTADRHLHRAAGAARSHARSVGRAESVSDVVARDPDLGPVAGRIRRDALARRGTRYPADGSVRRARVVDCGHTELRAAQSRIRCRSGRSPTRSRPVSCSPGP